MSFFQNIYGVLLRPSQTFKYLGVNYSPSLILQAALVMILIGAIKEGPSPQEVLGYFVYWFMLSSLLFLMGFVFKLKGYEYPKFLSILAFANLPLIFLAPVDLFAEINLSLGGFLKVLILLWSFNLNLIAVSKICDITKSRATLLYLIPPLMLAVILIKLLLDSISSFMLLL